MSGVHGNVHVVIKSSAYGGNLGIFKNVWDVRNFQAISSEKSIVVPFYVEMQNTFYITTSKYSYGGNDKGHVKVFNNIEDAEKFIEELYQKSDDHRKKQDDFRVYILNL